MVDFLSFLIYFYSSLVIFACHVSIYIKVRGGRFAQPHGAAGLREYNVSCHIRIVLNFPAACDILG